MVSLPTAYVDFSWTWADSIMLFLSTISKQLWKMSFSSHSKECSDVSHLSHSPGIFLDMLVVSYFKKSIYFQCMGWNRKGHHRDKLLQWHQGRLFKNFTKVNQANSKWQLVFFSFLQVPSENVHLSLLFTYPRPGLDCAMTLEVLKEVACILEILFPARKHIPRLKSCFYEIIVLVRIKDAGFPVQMSKYTFSFCLVQLPTCLKLQAHAEC